ncbi:MAG: hypothetical protein HY007_02235 [Candidatus Sungbacteria bacterium]|nr:hypothetical protein [Candidatus Sungbacteria bacterium]
MKIRIIKDTIQRDELRKLAREGFGGLVKAVVDLERGLMAIGGELHADEEAFLLKEGSKQQYLWGVNLYPDESAEHWIEFDSMINVRPSQNNRSRGIEDSSLREQIVRIVGELVVR